MERRDGTEADATGPGERRWFLPLLLLALTLLAAAGTSAWRGAAALLRAGEETTVLLETMRQVDEVRDALLEAETGTRGFLLTGDSAFLEPYLEGRVRLLQQLDSIGRLLPEDDRQSAVLTAIRSLAERRKAGLDSQVRLRRDRGASAAQSILAMRNGKILMDSLRLLLAAVTSEEEAELDTRRRELAAFSQAAMRRVAILGLVVVVLLTSAVIGLRREVRRRRAVERSLDGANRTLEERVSEAERKLRATELRLRGALDSMLEGCQLLDRDLRYVYVNPAAAAHGRSTVDALVGRAMTEAYPGIEATELYSWLREALDRGISRHVDNQFTFPDGSRGWFRLSIEPVPEGVFILSMDITTRVQAEESARHSEARHRSLLEGLPDLVFLTDGTGRVLDIHAPDASVLREPVPALIDRTVDQALGEEAGPSVLDAVRRVAATGRSVTLPFVLSIAGRARTFEANVVAAQDARVTVVARDVSVRHELEAQLRQAQKMEAIGQLTGGIAHDFNNILTVIGSNAELIASDPGSSPTVQEGIAEISTATRRGADMIGQLLRFSRRGMLTRRPHDPAVVIGAFSSMLRRLLPSTVTLEVETAGSGAKVLLDPGALEQIIANLCTNARDAMPDGGVVRIECAPTRLDEGYHATHPWVQPGDYLCVSVADTGTGMDEPTRQRVFEPFFTTKPAGAGTGLGLAMVYGLMKDHGGMVHVYSELGQGTVIKLYFPITDVDGASARPARRSDPTRIRGGGETILLVEDEAAIRRATRRALEGKGYAVLDAADGEQAIELFERHRDRVALVISDLVMPNLGGRQLAEALRARGATVPMLFTSGYSASAVYRDSEFPADAAFLHKPWTLSDLFTRVRAMLDGDLPEREPPAEGDPSTTERA